MAATLGKLDEFNPEVETISTYLKRVDVFFTANSVGDAKKSAVLLACIGPKTYGVLQNLLAPDIPATKDFATLSGTLKSHYDPKPSIIVQRCNFHKRRQQPGESVSHFMAELRRLAIFCDYADHLNDALRDQFVSGLGSEAILKRLLSEKALTVKSALELAIASEAAAKNAKNVHSSRSSRNQGG